MASSTGPCGAGDSQFPGLSCRPLASSLNRCVCSGQPPAVGPEAACRPRESPRSWQRGWQGPAAADVLRRAAALAREPTVARESGPRDTCETLGGAGTGPALQDPTSHPAVLWGQAEGAGGHEEPEPPRPELPKEEMPSQGPAHWEGKVGRQLESESRPLRVDVPGCPGSRCGHAGGVRGWPSAAASGPGAPRPPRTDWPPSTPSPSCRPLEPGPGLEARQRTPAGL